MTTPEPAPALTTPAPGERSRDGDGVAPWRPFKPLIILASFALVFACLRLAREVLIPVAFAMLLALVLSPAVTALQRRGLHRVVAAVAVVLLVFSGLGALVWVLGQQVTTLANDLPSYRERIRAKVAQVRLAGRGGSVEKVQETVKEVVDEVQKDDRAPARPRQPIPVVPGEQGWRIPSTIGTIAETTATVGLVLVLVIFMLVERQQLRNRLIRLIGHGRVTVTTQAMDDATSGIIRYLLMQSLVNASFGVAVAGGLLLLGVPYALLWGALAGILRFIPYVGTWMAALLPIAMSLAIFDGWMRPLLVIALFAVLEPFIYMVVEPLLYGHSIGVSQTALLVAVAFWTWLWGPLGLILATPLTVCLVVVGKYVPELDFIVTLVTDKPVLAPDLAYYQRLIAMDQDEAAEIVATQLPALGSPRIYDDVMVPALNYVRRDRGRGRLSDEQAAFAMRASREIVEGTVMQGPPPGPATARGRVLAIAGRDDADEVALGMLADLLAPSAIAVEIVPAELLPAEVIAIAERVEATCICVASLPPGGIAHTRYLLKRLRARFPDACIIVGRWGCQGETEDDVAPLLAAGASRVGRTLAATRDHVLELLPLTAATPALARTA